MSRLSPTFARLSGEGRAALVTFITAGDPDTVTTAGLLAGLPDAGADIIELGMPFSDPMADGPSIQAASQRALAGGMTMAKTLELVRGFRAGNATTPIVLMGYFNPLLQYGLDPFCRDAAAAGADGLIIVDLPPEEDAELKAHTKAHGLDIIRLATPTSDAARMAVIADGASGFLYYVSVAGITGDKQAVGETIAPAVARLKAVSGLPVCIGFGIKTPENVREMAAISDGAVVGSAIVDRIARGDSVEDVLAFVKTLAGGVKGTGA